MYGVMRVKESEEDVTPYPICISENIESAKKQLEPKYPLLVTLEITGVYEKKKEVDGEMIKGFTKIA